MATNPSEEAGLASTGFPAVAPDFSSVPRNIVPESVASRRSGAELAHAANLAEVNAVEANATDVRLTKGDRAEGDKTERDKTERDRTEQDRAEQDKAELHPAASSVVRERREEARYPVDARAVVLMVKSAIAMPGRVLDLSMHGCQIRTEQRFTVGIFVRVEIEFQLRGITFRLSGVTQSIHGVYSVGVRFLALSERRRSQLAELIAELNESP